MSRGGDPAEDAAKVAAKVSALGWKPGEAARWPSTLGLLKQRWLDEQAAGTPAGRSTLYDWLMGETRADEFLDALELALQILGPRGRNPERAARLTAVPKTSFWSAMCELFLAAHLERSGVAIAFHSDTPDLRATASGGATVGIELTADFASVSWADLSEEVAKVWAGPGTLVMICPDETVRFLERERDALLALLSAASPRDLAPTAPSNDDELWQGGLILSEEERSLPIEHLIDRARLEVYWNPRGDTYVASRSGALWGFRDPWTNLVDRAEGKAKKMPPDEVGIVAIECGYLHTSTHIWADLVRTGRLDLDLCLGGHVAGILIYWQDIRFLAPAKPIFFWSRCFTGDRAGVDRVLSALQASTVLPVAVQGGQP